MKRVVTIMKNSKNKVTEAYEPEVISIEDLHEDRVLLNEFNLPLHRYSEDGHSWNGRAYVDYISRAEF